MLTRTDDTMEIELSEIDKIPSIYDEAPLLSDANLFAQSFPINKNSPFLKSVVPDSFQKVKADLPEGELSIFSFPLDVLSPADKTPPFRSSEVDHMFVCDSVPNDLSLHQQDLCSNKHNDKMQSVEPEEDYGSWNSPLNTLLTLSRRIEENIEDDKIDLTNPLVSEDNELRSKQKKSRTKKVENDPQLPTTSNFYRMSAEGTEHRQRAIARWQQKKEGQASNYGFFKYTYPCRKRFADNRPRIAGKFVGRERFKAMLAAVNSMEELHELLLSSLPKKQNIKVREYLIQATLHNKNILTVQEKAVLLDRIFSPTQTSEKNLKM